MVLILLLLITSCLFDMSAFNCLHPRFITDSRGQQKFVRCGHCVACENIKAFSYTNQCKLESQSHKYTLFVTLTYSNENLPLVKPVPLNGYIYYTPVSPRLHAHYVRSGRPFFAVSSEKYLPMNRISAYNLKFSLPEHLTGLIPVLDKVDVQKFLKRLRYYLTKETDEKIRYYAVGEYGPVHFRPHYHLLLWYDEAQTARVMGEAILKAWNFGRVDYQISKGNTASYVASYANSISARSRLHGVKYLRPFVLHSSRLFGSFYQDAEEALFETTFETLNGRCLADNGRNQPITPPFSFEDRYFGRCINYDQKSHHERLVCFTFATEAYREFGEKTVAELADLIWSNEDSRCHYLMQCFTFNGKFRLQTVQSVLYRSRRFLKMCDIYHVTPDAYVSLIERYWQDKDYFNLYNQLSEQQQYTAELGTDFLPYLLCYYDVFPAFSDAVEFCPPYFPRPILDYLSSIGLEPQWFVDNVFNKTDNPLYKEFASRHLKLSCDRVKHKRLNDLNNIFL